MLNLLLGLLISTIPLPSKPAHYVTDNAGVIDAVTRSRIEQKLADFERKTSDQVIVYVDKKVPEGTTLEEMSAQAIHEWGVGQKGKNNGVILFVFTEDRKMRIEVGYGLEGSLTDAKSKLITSTVIKPLLQRGDYGGAIEHGVDAIVGTISGEGYKGSGETAAEAGTGASKTLVLPLVIMAIVALVFIGLIVGFIVALIAFFRRLARNTAGAGSNRSSASGDSSWSSSSSSSFDSGSSDSGSSDSSSDFSGGGGDGGGGGASDSW